VTGSPNISGETRRGSNARGAFLGVCFVASNSYNVRNVNSSGALNNNSACNGRRGVRPLCYLNSEILVSIPGEECDDAEPDTYAETVNSARDDVLNMLNAYPLEVWGDALAAAVSSLFRSKLDAAEIALEEQAKRAAEG